MKPDQQRVCDVVMQTVIKLCASGLEGSVARVEGVIGVTVDDNDVFLIHINDTVHSLSARASSDDAVSLCRKRARHRLLFESEPDIAMNQPSKESTTVIHQGTSNGSGAGRSREASESSRIVSIVPGLQQLNGVMLTEDVKLTTAECDSELAAVVVVDSDDEDVKLVVDEAPESAGVCKQERSVKPVLAAADAVSSLCIADVVGSVSSTAFNDVSTYQNDDDEDTVETETNGITRRRLAWTKAAPARRFQVTSLLFFCTMS